MKAIVFPAYGGPEVLRYEEIDTPVPRDNEVRIRVHAASVNAGDWHLLRADPFLVRLAFGLFKPKVNILGADLAGTVESVGQKVTQFAPGDAVFGDISPRGFGAFAEYACAPESLIAIKPENLSFSEAAAVPAAGVTALQALRDSGRIRPGENVLVNGASGGVGSYAVQIAKALGAEVTGVCSTRNLDHVRTLGADKVIDYTREDFTQAGALYDLIHAANGDLPIDAYRRALRPGGRYVMSGGATRQFYQAALRGPWISMTSKVRMGSMLVKPNQSDLVVLREFLESGKVKPVIDRSYPLAEVPDAIRYMENEHAQGKIIIRVADGD